MSWRESDGSEWLVADFGGRYRLDRRLGAGGMGEVWLAYDEDLDDRPVAIKVMRSRMLADDGDLARFQREMRLASRMHHPNIMTVFTTGSDRGVPFMVTEYLQGSDLGKMPDGWSFEEIARIGRQTCTALGYAHGLDPGVVHRDIKPGNLFICDTGLVKVMDFGLAKAITGSSLSTAGTVMGTMLYVSPEQWLGAPAAFSNDVWAVGCVLYELLSGKLPRPYETPIEHVAAAARGEFVAPLPGDSGVPAWLADAVLAMLHPDPLDRPSASEAVQLLSARRTHAVQAVGTSPQQSAAMLQSPTRRDMAMAASPQGAQSPGWQRHQPAGDSFGSTGTLISSQGRQETPRADASARVLVPEERATRPRNRPRNKRNLLISSIAALGAVAVATYLAVSAVGGPTTSQVTGRAGMLPSGKAAVPIGTGAVPPGTGTAPAGPQTAEPSAEPAPKGVTIGKAPAGNPVGAQQIALQMMPKFGFDQKQYGCLLALWNKVSGWDVYAKGPAGQYGIPQALPGEVMAAAGPNWQTNAATQIAWGLGYIRKTYGTPCAALVHEEKSGYY
jgi:serine/threonine protein kinase